MNPRTAIFQGDQRLLEEGCEQLLRESLAKSVFVFDRNGQVLARVGETAAIDTTSLASLVAGTTAATSSLAKLLGEPEFPVHFHEGVSTHLHVSVAGEEGILAVIFDQRSSLGLVRLRVKRSTPKIAEILTAAGKRSAQMGTDIFAQITDEDIDNLFSENF